MIYFLYCALVVLLLVISIFSFEAWPFSSYPMFSTPLQNNEVGVIYLTAELANGTTEKLKFSRKVDLQKRLDSAFKLKLSSDSASKENITPLVNYYFRLYKADQKRIGEVSKLHLVHLKKEVREKQETVLFTFEAKEFNTLK